jgi:hypothetical protein
VRDDNHRGDDSELDADQECAGCDHAIHAIVKRCANDHHHRYAALFAVCMVRHIHLLVAGMAMPPQHQLLKNKEQQDGRSAQFP